MGLVDESFDIDIATLNESPINLVIEYLKHSTHHHNLQLIDCGCYSNERCDYPLIARDVALKVIESKDTISFGILI